MPCFASLLSSLFCRSCGVGPKYDEQKAISDVLTEMDDEIEALEDERGKMLQIREGAMDDLLTGRVRLEI